MGLVRAWHRTPLWMRLISAMLVLAALGVTVTGVFGVRLLRGYLVDRVDEQLADAADQLMLVAADMPGAGTQLPSQFHVTLLRSDGVPYRTWVSRLSESTPELPRLSVDQAADRAGDPFTVDAARGRGSWRARALPLPDGSGSLVVAASLEEVDATVARLGQIDLLVGLAVVAGLAIVGVTMVRGALRPLVEIEITAAAIGRGDLARRVPDHHPGTELGRLSRALNAMLEQIERGFRARAASEAESRRSEERMRRFVADASHELRTPLTSIRGFAELHRQGAVTDPEEVSRLLGRIEDEAKRMGLLVDDLLLLARLDQQRPLQRTPVDLAHVAAEAVEAAQAQAPDRAVDLEVAPGDADPAGGLTVEGDEPRLHQVVGNLLDNALAYSPAGTPVTVRVGPVVRDGAHLVSLDVIDRGPGLTPEQSQRVFERFYRIDAARSRARGGTGLGLSIVAAITAAHGGRVEVDSAVGAGSTFRVLLPAATPPGPAAPGRTDAKGTGPAVPAPVPPTPPPPPAASGPVPPADDTRAPDPGVPG